MHDAAAMGAHMRLATYGSLAPGKPNHHQLGALSGTWSRGVVHGRLIESGWGAALGFPALILDTDGDEVEVDLFASPDLPGFWDWLDRFEGSDYLRVVTTVQTRNNSVEASIYVAR